MNERKCIRCESVIHPTAKATHNDPENYNQDIVAHIHGYCSYTCIREYSQHKAFVGEAWWQK